MAPSPGDRGEAAFPRGRAEMTVLREVAAPAWHTGQCQCLARTRAQVGHDAPGCRFAVPMGTHWGRGGVFFFRDKEGSLASLDLSVVPSAYYRVGPLP